MLALLGPSLTRAADRTPVGISFHLMEENFGLSFPTAPDPASGLSARGVCEKTVTAAMAAALKQQLGFIPFAVDANLPVQLRVDLVGKPSSNPLLVETVFKISVVSAVSAAGVATLEWQFRPATEYMATVRASEFPGEVAALFEGHLRQVPRVDELVRMLQDHVSLAREVGLFPQGNRFLCVLPLTYEDLWAGSKTKFVIVCEIPGGFGDEERRYVEGLPGSAASVQSHFTGFNPGIVAKEILPVPSDGADLASLASGAPAPLVVPVLAIRLKEYVPRPPALVTPPSPAEVQLP
jgi:hypothetical protein